MTLPFSNLDRKQKLFLAVTFSVFLFIYKLIFPILASLGSSVINDIIIITSIYLWYIFVIDLKETTIASPLPLILNTGIVITLIFFILSVSTSIFEKFSSFGTEFDFLIIILAILITYIFTAFFIYIFTSLRILFFLKQKKDYSKLFNTTLIFFALTFLSSTITWWHKELLYINLAFTSVTILLIVINSTRVAWIAFLNKKQKIYLLIISAILAVICLMIGGILQGEQGQENVIEHLIANFSPGLLEVFDLIRIYTAIYFGIIFFTALFHLPTADAFDRRSDELSSLMNLTKLLNQVFDFNELADTITSITARVCNADYAWLVTNKNGKIIISSLFNVGYVETEMITNLLIDENISLFDEILIIDFEKNKNKLNINSNQNNFNYIAIAPLKVHNDINGYLFAARKNNYTFDEDDKKAIRSFANYASIALENAQLLEQSIEKERLEKELEVARDVQQRLLPAKTPQFENIEIATLFKPAFEVGGDYFDFFELGNNKLGFVIADVSGKGISAAFIMAEVKGIFESLTHLVDKPKILLTKANEVLKLSLEKKNFVTAIYGILDLLTGKVIFARAGHNPVLHISRGLVNRLIPSGIGLGLDYTEKFEKSLKETEISLFENDILIFYTDGVTEAQNSKLQEFGQKRFEKVVIENADKSAEIITEKILNEIKYFVQDHQQHDDITMLIMKWKRKKI